MNKFLALCFTSAWLAGVPVCAQPPHLADGTPDLGGNGVWHPHRVGDLAAKAWKNGGALEKSADRNVDVPFLPWAKTRSEENRAGQQPDSAARCLPPGVPRIVLTAEPFEIVQQPKRILFIYEAGAHVWRNVWMDGRPHPHDPNPSWLGDSIGHWDRDTLVVDAIGFNDKTWLDDAGHPHTEQLHVVERYTRNSALSMTYEVMIEDPGAYAKPWSNRTTISFRPGETLQEYICLEGERDRRR
ncbi:MAG TPA: hypothetical protein VIY49_36770 [Bryobacteraceae bacterium]